MFFATLDFVARRVFITLLASTLMVSGVAVESGTAAPKENAPPGRYNFPKSAWPEFVTVRVPVVARVWEDGKDVGTVGLRKGIRLRVLNLDKAGILEVEFAGARCFVDHAATDFVEKLK